MNIVLISLFHYDNFAVRLLFSYLRNNNIPIIYVSFKRLRQKATKTLKNDYVEMHDYHTEVTEEDINVLLNQLEKLNPALIGISLQSPHFQIAKRLTQAIKNKFKVPIVWGGAHPTLDPENCINCLDYDSFRRRSVSNVIEELVQTKQNNPNLKFVFFWDNIFAINKKWCFEFSEAYREKINLPFFNYSHPLCSDMEIFTALRKAGWAVTVMGIQSGSFNLRRTLYDRKETNGQILEATKRLNALQKVKSCRRYFRIYYDYVKNNPLEGKKDLSESLDLFLKFPKGFIFQAFNLSWIWELVTQIPLKEKIKNRTLVRYE